MIVRFYSLLASNPVRIPRGKTDWNVINSFFNFHFERKRGKKVSFYCSTMNDNKISYYQKDDKAEHYEIRLK